MFFTNHHWFHIENRYYQKLVKSGSRIYEILKEFFKILLKVFSDYLPFLILCDIQILFLHQKFLYKEAA